MEIEYLKSLGFTEEEAIGINATQSYEPPTDPQEAVNHSHQWSNYDRAMGGLDSDLANNIINTEEYLLKQAELYNKATRGKL